MSRLKCLKFKVPKMPKVRRSRTGVTGIAQTKSRDGALGICRFRLRFLPDQVIGRGGYYIAWNTNKEQGGAW